MGVSNSERDLLSNQEKTNDELRAIFSGWQYDAAWTAYNEQNELRMGEVDVFARSLFLYGEAARAEEAKYGLHPEYSDAAFARALVHGNNQTCTLANAGQGMLIHNATQIAKLITAFLESSGRQGGALV